MQLHLQINPLVLFVRGVLPVALLGFSVAVVLLINGVLGQGSQNAEQGVLDLRYWPGDVDDRLLAGEWGFYWEEYLPPEDMMKESVKTAPVFLSLPGVWSGLNYQGSTLPMQGKASLLLRVLLPDSSAYVLKVPTLTNRYRLWINGELRVNDPLEEPLSPHARSNGARFFTVEPIDNEVVVMFHLQNDRHRVGGIWERLRLVRIDQQDIIAFWPKVQDAVIAFLLSLVSLVLIIRAIYERCWHYIFLAIFSAFMSLRAGTVNERLFFSLLGIEDWEWQQALEHGALFASLPFFAMYLGRRFPSYFPALLHWLTASICGVLIALVFITAPSVYSHTVPIFQATALIYAFLWMGAVLEHVIKKERAALALLFGGMIFIVAGVNDILYASNSIDSTNLMQLGALGFILMSFFYKGNLVKQDVLIEEATAVNQLHKDPLIADKVTHGLAIAYDEYQQQPNEEHLKYLAAESLCFALATWENATSKNKIALAEMSGLWRVTNDGGTLKTRTFDKYLKVATLPQNPRYKLIAKTLRYIAKIDGVLDDDVFWIERVADVYDRR
ncbi:hypothetical protein A9Q81_09700 [Gammaproteobacteria bacterium 42_54_T18]|nr:hypothetical protein A9Q81_09700 [Gammaproteobacteria bacterium 42_54_T18]